MEKEDKKMWGSASNIDYSSQYVNEILKQLKELKISDPNNAEIFDSCGTVLFGLAKYKRDETLFKEAFENYDEATRINPCFENAFYNWGTALFEYAIIKRDETIFKECFEKFNKVIQLNPNHAYTYTNWGNALINLATMLEDETLYYESISKLEKASFLNPDDANIYALWGSALYNLGRIKEDELLCREAYEKCNIAIKLNPANVEALINCGNALFGLARIGGDVTFYREAIEKYEMASSLNPNSAWAYHSWGTAILDLAKITEEENLYKESIAKYEKASSIDSNLENNFYCWGVALFYLGVLKEDEALLIEAMSKYEKASVLDPKFDYIYNNWGAALFFIGMKKKDETLYRKAFEKYEETVKINPNNPDVYLNWGNALLGLAKIKKDKILLIEAIEKYKIGAELNQDKPDVFCLLGNAICNLAMINNDETLLEEVINCFVKAGKDLLRILAFFDQEDGEYAIDKKLFHSFLDLNTVDGLFFRETTKGIDTDLLEKYKEVFILSILLISKLHVNNEYEKLVSYYSKKTIAEKLLFRDKKFRLNAINYSNDPKEGETLLDCLFEKEKKHNIKTTNYKEYTAFAGCFTFNYDSLNQFRLYGKDNGNEGTGLSLVFRNSFFSEEVKMPIKQPEADYKATKNKKEKLTLFRCIYLDPETGQAESVGQKENYLFRREDDGKAIENYNKYIDGIVISTNKIIGKLKEFVEDLNKNVVSQLLINLRYLTKHVAFKEEQECRIIKVQNLKNKNIKMNKKFSQMYIKYEPKVSTHIEKIYFGPKASGIELFEDILASKGLTIHCEKSQNPLA